MQEKIAKTKGDQKELFKIVKTLLCLKKQTVLPEYCDPAILASSFNQFFVDKIEHIRAEFPLLEQSLPSYSFGTCTTTIVLLLWLQHVLLLLKILPWLLLRS